jgi:hypothetical protein
LVVGKKKEEEKMMMIRTMRGMAFLVLVALCGGVGAVEGMKEEEKSELVKCYELAKEENFDQLKLHYQDFFTYKKTKAGANYGLFRYALEENTSVDHIMKFLEVMRYGSTPGLVGKFGTLKFNEEPGMFSNTYSADAFYTAFIFKDNKNYGTLNYIINNEHLSSADKLKIIKAILGYLTEIQDNNKSTSYLLDPIIAIDKEGNNSLRCIIKNYNLLGREFTEILESILEALKNITKKNFEIAEKNLIGVKDSTLYQILARKNGDNDPFLHSLIKNKEINLRVKIIESILKKLNDIAPRDIYTLFRQKGKDGDTFFTVLVSSKLKEKTMIEILSQVWRYFFNKETKKVYPFMLNKAQTIDGKKVFDPYKHLILQSNKFSANPLLLACLNKKWKVAAVLKIYNAPLLDKVPSIILEDKKLQDVIGNPENWKKLVKAINALKEDPKAEDKAANMAEKIKKVWVENVEKHVEKDIIKKVVKNSKSKVSEMKEPKKEFKPEDLQKALSLLKAKLLSLATQLKK